MKNSSLVPFYPPPPPLTLGSGVMLTPELMLCRGDKVRGEGLRPMFT